MSTAVSSGLVAMSAALIFVAEVARCNDTSYAPYFPEGVRHEAIAALKEIEFSEAKMNDMEHVTFASAESSTLSKEPIINRIHHYAQPRFDIWLMRQRQGEKDGWDTAYWSLVGIIVDLFPADGGRPIAYYLEFAPQPVAKGALPTPIEPRVACYRCHANGPRAIRPLRAEGLPPLADAPLARIRAWNVSIVNAGVVRNHQTTAGEATQIYAVKEAMIDLPQPKCRQCHDSATGIRSELKRIHAGSISFLATHGDTGDGTIAAANGAHAVLPAYNRSLMLATAKKPAMPIEDEPLTEDEARCLTAWLMGQPTDSSCFQPPPSPVAGMHAPPTPVLADPTWIIDSAASQLQARVETSVATFTVAGLVPYGVISCSKNTTAATCEIDAAVNMAQATSGISLRDQHMKQYLKVAQFLEGQAHAGPIAWPDLHKGSRTIQLPLVLKIAGISAPSAVQLTCSAEDEGRRVRCTVQEFTWNMRAHHIEPPSFLGLKVAAEVRVVGQLILVASASPRDGSTPTRPPTTKSPST